MKTRTRLLPRLRRDRGQSLVEFALVLPILFLLILNAVNFGGFFYAWITVANAARAGANYAALGGASVGTPEATASQVTSMITTEISTLPNNSSRVVDICQNNNGTVTALSGTCSSIPGDPEPGNFVLTSVDVIYTYKPYISGFQFPNLRVFLTIPPTTIHMRTVMRSIQ